MSAPTGRTHSGEFEEIAVERGSRSGALMAIAVHSTVLGPALGGARMWHYPDGDHAVADAMRLAEAMTHKAAAAGLDLGGGKGVIATPAEAAPDGRLRRAILLDFGDLVESLEGRYVTAEDVGTSAEDMAVIAERTTHVVGLGSDHGGSGDPSPVTALGVRAAMRACAGHAWGTPDLASRRVTLIGFGHVGSHLAELLAADGAELAITDVNPARRGPAEALGARWIEPVEALAADCDVLAPCALGGLIDAPAAERLRCRVLCGAANNVLADPGVADLLEARGVVYAPDFIANAGGLISVYGDLHRTPHGRAVELAAGIETTIGVVLEEARRRGITSLAAARRRSLARLGSAHREPGRGVHTATGSTQPAGARMRHS